MPKEIRLGTASRLYKASDIMIRGKQGQMKGAALDFARDHIIILDEDNRPVAECWPIEHEPGEPVKPVIAHQAAAKDQVAQNGLPVARAGLGPLTDAQRVILNNLWTKNPTASLEEIGTLFEQKAGRTVSAITVENYRPQTKK